MMLMRPERGNRRAAGISIVEVVVAVLLLGTLVLALFGAFSSGIRAVQSARENMRASQIMMQKMETVRLLTWAQSTNTVVAPATFKDYYDPSGTNTQSGGAVYSGTVTVAPAPVSVPAAYRPNMRLVTVNIFWTNYVSQKRIIVQSRQMETLIARWGVQNYVY